MRKEVTAIVVARKGSNRVKQKNKLPLCGTPMYLRKLQQLQGCSTIDRVIFGSDDEEMLEEAKKHGVEVVHRPDYFCDEAQASANDMIGNMMDLVETDIVVWAHCTNPLISSRTYDEAVNEFFSHYPQYDSLLSVVKLQEHLWHEIDGAFKPLNYNPYGKRHIPARELPPYYMQDGGIFIQPYDQMKENRYFFGRKPLLFCIQEDEFLDVNTIRDYMLASVITEAHLDSKR